MTNKPKILLTSLSGQFGGMEVRMVDEARILKEIGYDVHVVTPAFPAVAKFAQAMADISIPFTPFSPAPIFTNWQWRHVAWLYAETWQRHVFNRFAADFVHVFFSWTDQGLDNLWFAGRGGTPAMLSIHNAFPKTEFPVWYHAHLRTAFKAVRGLYGVSTSALDHFIDNFSDLLPCEASKSVIYNFVDTDRFTPSADRRRETRNLLSIPENASVLGSVGRFDDQKKPLSVVSVFAAVKKQVPDARLLLIGEGSQEAAVRDRIRALGCEDAVTILGFRPDVEKYFPAMDAHMLLSRNEGFGIVTAEAMACGVATIGTNVPGTAEVIGDCPAGRLVPLGDEDEAVRCAVELFLLSTNDRYKLGRIARQHVENRFSKKIWIESVTSFYAVHCEGRQKICASE